MNFTAYPPAPRGYVAIYATIYLLETKAAEWGIRFPSQKRDTHADHVNWFEPILAPRLADGYLRAIGVSKRSGRYFRAPVETWRVMLDDPESTGRVASAVRLALHGLPVPVPFGQDQSCLCYSFVAHRDLALAFDAPNPPPCPPPLDIQDLEPPSPASVPTPSAPEPDVTKSKGGRLPRHDWEAFWIEVAWWGEDNHEFEPENKFRPELQRHMERWCDRQWGAGAVDERTIRGKLQIFYAAGKRRAKPDQT